MGTTKTLAEFLVKTTYSDFPDDAVRVAKLFVLDCLGHMLGGAQEPVSQLVIKHVKESGGVEEAGVVAAGFRTSVCNAVLVNGTSAHALELECAGRRADSNYLMIIPSALSLGEKFKVSGKAVLESVILGIEIKGRVALGTPGARAAGLSPISLWGPIGVAALASKMMGLTVDQTRDAIGLSISQCGGTMRQGGTMAHVVESGFACRAGITSALLARDGMSADPDLIEGERGFCDLYAKEQGSHDLAVMTKNLGNPFFLLNPGTMLKKYGCCMGNHRALDALVQLIQEHDIHYEDVDSVLVEMPPTLREVAKFTSPQNSEQSKFNIRHAVGAALLDGKIEFPYLRPFSESGAADPRYRDAWEKIKLVVHEDWPSTREKLACPVTITMKDGRTYSKAVEEVKGDTLTNPLSAEERIAMYEACAARVLSPKDIRRSADMVLNMEKLDDVLELMDLVTFCHHNAKGG